MATGTNRVEGKIAVVTGGASGIGKGTVRRLLDEGAKVVIADMNAQQGQALAAELGENAVFQQLDVSDEASWQALSAAVDKRFGRWDVLVNCAGINGSGTIEEATYALWHKVMGVNAAGVFLGCKYAVEAMRKAGGGSIINISSTMGLRAVPSETVYCASKAAVTHLTRAVALHCANSRYNIRCNSVHPGVIETPILNPFIEAVGQDAAMNAFASIHPMGRVGQPAEVAAAIVFLASDEASYITGIAMPVDGGYNAQ